MGRITLTKLFPRDVEELHAASERLAIVADALRSAKYANGPALIQLLIEANDPIVRIMNKGAACIARSLERRQGPVASEEPELPIDQVPAPGDQPAAEIEEG